MTLEDSMWTLREDQDELSGTETELDGGKHGKDALPEFSLFAFEGMVSI